MLRKGTWVDVEAPPDGKPAPFNKDQSASRIQELLTAVDFVLDKQKRISPRAYTVFLGGRSILIRHRCLDEQGFPGGSRRSILRQLVPENELLGARSP
jgi:hypothetical protein